MLLFAFAILLEITPPAIPQGQVVQVKASSEGASVRFNGTTIPLFSQPDGSRYGLVPVPALTRPGKTKLELLDGTGRVLETGFLTVQDARFRTQNVTMGRSLTQLKPATGEMETVTALRKTVSPVRYWTEPFLAPTPGCLTSPFGVRRMHNGKLTGSYHGGLDQRGAEGVPVRATNGGIVRIARKFNIHGDTVGIDHGNGVVSFYLHLSSFATSEGAEVKKGDLIGSIGSTGRSTAPHLHWAVNVHGVPVNPLQWMKLEECASRPAVKKRKPAKR